MPDRRLILGEPPERPELDRLVQEAKLKGVTDEELREQRLSFAYGNAQRSSRITKESVRDSSRNMRMAHA